MSTAEKVELVASVQEKHGLNHALAAVGLPKSTWYYQQRHKVTYEEKYAHLRTPLEMIARKHSAYGYRRTRKELQEQYGISVSKSVLQRLHRLWRLRLLRSTHAPRPSLTRRIITEAGDHANLVAQMSEIALFQVVYTDFTELLYGNGTRKVYLMSILGHTSKLVFGWAVGKRAHTALALQAWEQAKITFNQFKVAYGEIIMHHDQDSVYTSSAWTRQLLLVDRVRLSYALNGAKDNPEMESFYGRFKGENRSLFQDAATLDELRVVVAERLRYYNSERRHSSLGYIAPLAFIQQQL